MVHILMMAANAAHGQGHGSDDRQNGNRGQQFGIDRRSHHAKTGREKMKQACNIVGDGCDRQALDGLLQAELKLHTIAHCLEKVPVLAFECDLDPGPQPPQLPRSCRG